MSLGGTGISSGNGCVSEITVTYALRLSLRTMCQVRSLARTSFILCNGTT
jgi:hypothetical protein